jgi:Protein of unknown function (DUF2530)
MKLTRERAARPSPPPLEANDQVVIWVGTAAWAVALVVLLVVRDSLPAGQRWWIWTCVCGVAFGIFASWYVPRLKRGRARAAARRAVTGEGEVGGEQAEGDGRGQSAPRDSGSNTVSSTETPGRSTTS